LNELGKWSIVTGATAGIGQAMAHELAKRGQNVLIIGRNREKLKEVESEIRRKNSTVEIASLEMDLAHLTEENKKNYREFIEKKRYWSACQQCWIGVSIYSILPRS